MRRRIMRLLLGVYRRLPRLWRRWIVRMIAPSFTVGAMAIIERPDGAVLLVRHSYRRRWGVPGGLMKRGEHPEVGLRREVQEEVGVEVDLLGEPAVVVDPDPQRVDLVFRGRLRPETAEARPMSPEILEVGWFLPDELPELQFETAPAIAGTARPSPPGGRLASTGDVIRPSSPLHPVRPPAGRRGLQFR
jgi:8-oxo-dGTP diphosphatase